MKNADVRDGYKVLTHDLCSPLQGGEPLCGAGGAGGGLPLELPGVRLDGSGAECGAGWNYCGTLEGALAIAGLWPAGRPSRGFRVRASADCIERGSKRRASSLTLLSECTDDDFRQALLHLSAHFGKHQARMVEEQVLWRAALARPRHDPAAVEAGLRTALSARGLSSWQLKLYPSARGAWDARGARGAWDAWAARLAWDAWAAWAAWAARGAWDARGARGAWAARDALTVCYTALMGWTPNTDPLLLTTGLRDAYTSGLEVAFPVCSSSSPPVLGYAIVS
jgi:hypothetical protein